MCGRESGLRDWLQTGKVPGLQEVEEEEDNDTATVQSITTKVISRAANSQPVT